MPVLTLNDQQIDYDLRRSHRARALRLMVQRGGTVVVTAPYSIAIEMIERFMISRSRWIGDHIKKLSRLLPMQHVASGRTAYLEHRERAREHVTARLTYWSERHDFQWRKVAIKDHHAIWGSCSRRGNLNFNYRLVLLPSELADYVIVHELCHLREQNHSTHFWRLVASILPDYQESRRRLKGYSVR